MPASRRSADRAKLRDRPAVESVRRQIPTPCPGAAPPIRWRRLDPDNLPRVAGVYAIRSGARWLYIGRSSNIAQRLQNPWHPAQITLELESLQMTYHWHPHPPDGLHRLEAALIRQHAPEWNGGTSFTGQGCEAGPFCDLPLVPTATERERAEAARGLLLA